MLTSDQISTFQREGVLVLPGFFDSREVSAVCDEVLEHYRLPSTPAEWRAALRTYQGIKVRSAPSLESHPGLLKLYRALHARARWEGENQLVTRPGGQVPPWMGARAPHLDFPVAAPLRTLANNVIYWTDVRAQGGAFMYWPGSHHVAWGYFRRHPKHYMAQGRLSQDQVFADLMPEITTEPVEFLGKAGDLMIWHSLLMHSGSRNMRREARIATFGRWGVPLGKEPLYDFDRDIWSYWDFDCQPETPAPVSMF
jgi:hypothetical protein